MRFLQRFLIGLGAILVLAISPQLVAPKSVHAVVSTLVTIANTSTNPVPVDSSADSRASVALIGRQQINPPNSEGFQPFLNLTDLTAFVVPVGKRFVIDQITASAFTDVSAQPTIAMELKSGQQSSLLRVDSFD
jgi:hypothetical protein